MKHRLFGPFGCVAVLAMSSVAAGGDCDNPQPPTLVHRSVPSAGNVQILGFEMDTDGQSLVLGDPYFRRVGTPFNVVDGCAQIARRTGTGWQVEQTYIGTDGEGQDVAVEGDLAATLNRSGRLSVLERLPTPSIDGPWTRTATISAQAVEVSVHGGRIYLGTRGGGHGLGTIVEFVRGPSGWSSTTVVSAFGTYFANGSQFAVSGDGLVAADPGNRAVGVERAGEVRVYRRGPNGWSVEAVLSGRPVPPNRSDYFGSSVALDGDTAVIAANWDPAGGLTGYARVFRRDAAGSWIMEAELTHPTAPTLSNTGYAFGVAARGDRIAIGSSKDDFAAPDGGAVYVYERSESGAWMPVGSFTLNDSAAVQMGLTVRLGDGVVVASAHGLEATGGAVVFDACSLGADPGDRTPRCLPGVLGLLTYCEAFFGGDLFADYDQSGTITVQDFFEFLADWFAGCV